MLNANIHKTIKMYGGEIELSYNDAGHRYAVNGSEIMGVTTALQVINKPALIQWGINLALEYVAENIKAGEKYDEIRLKEVLQSAKTAHRKKKEQAGDFGTMVHEWIESYIKGQNPKPLVNKLLQQACEMFVAWANDNKVKFTQSERIIYSRKHNYAGTCDFTAEIDGLKYVGDIKTSTGIYNEYGLQTAAYRLALEEETGERYDGMIVVRVPKVEGDSVEIAYINNYEKNARAFLCALYLKQHFNLLQAARKGGEK